jgi:hypothetical protein
MKAKFLKLLSGSLTATLLFTNSNIPAVQAQGSPENSYGYGLNLNWYCKQKYGSSSREALIENNAYGWRCFRQGQYIGINVDEACKMQYGSSARSALGDYNDATSWYCKAQHLSR